MSIHQSFQVRLGERSHPVHVGQGLLARSDIWPVPRGSRKALVCLDAHLAGQRDALLTSLSVAGWEPACEILTGSEALKDFQTLLPLYGSCLEHGLQRRSLLVAVGGGTIGDAVGFLAATYLRGIPWVSVPSTLLAQVDSGLGGKTGVNHPAGKNLIGAIWQPAAIVCDTDLLQGLGQRDLVSGLGEMLKYGLIADAGYWSWLKHNLPGILRREPELLAEGILCSLQIKARYVEADEPDLSGVRAALNFGHTFAHALEAVA
ncbi:MAG: 3-dehydroquinate synthase, partial [Candidatus Sericytochromatia bacterium]